MSKRPNKMLLWTAESLNEYAQMDAQGKEMPNHRPSSPSYWFYGLLRDTRKVWDEPTCRELLCPEAIALIERA